MTGDLKTQRDRRSRLQLSARRVRHTWRRISLAARQALRYGRFSLNGTPVLFANSFPKSGTHLLTQVLQGFPRVGPAVDSGLPAVVTYQGDSGRQRPAEEVLADLRQLRPGDISYGHLHALPEVVACLSQPAFATYFILRDPRDVVVSHVHYVTEMEPQHALHTYYTQELHSFDERLNVSICGLPEIGFPFPDIRARFEPFLGWLDAPAVLTLCFEDFITDRDSALERVLKHAVQRGFPLDVSWDVAHQVLADSIDPQRSPTFRSGKIGGWRKQFSEQHKRLFKEVSGDLLIRLGYEADNDW